MAELKFEVPEGTVEGLFSEPGGEGFRVLVEAVAQALINSQAEAHFGAPWNARGMERPNGYRNGYKSRGFQTVAGALDLSIPQARSGGFRPTLFDRWQRSERALLAACGEMVLAGVSNRNVSRLAEEAFGAEVSPRGHEQRPGSSNDSSDGEDSPANSSLFGNPSIPSILSPRPSLAVRSGAQDALVGFIQVPRLHRSRGY